MADIALSKGVRQNLLSMQSTVDLMSRTQNRLATGKKVNSALDNPTNFFVAAGLENRSSDLSRLLDSMGLGIKTLEAADNGIKAIKKLIETAQGTARQALQAASSTPTVTASRTDLLGTTDLNAAGNGGFVAADTITVAVDGGAPVTVFTADGTDTLQDVVDGINANATLNPPNEAPKVKASVENGRLKIESLTGVALTVSSNDVTKLGTLVGASTTLIQEESMNTIRSTLASQFEELKTQLDQLIKDAGFNGVNLLNGDELKVLFNETNTTSITIYGVVFNSEGLGLAPVTNGASADSPYKWQSDDEINAALEKLSDALNLVRTQASDFGSNLIVLQTRQDFTKQSILTLNAGADLLTLADTTEEGANLLALQTRQQLSTQALSLASQTDQAVLRLFG
jgi:flagellin-like hook-associated protein FlgL